MSSIASILQYVRKNSNRFLSQTAVVGTEPTSEGEVFDKYSDTTKTSTEIDLNSKVSQEEAISIKSSSIEDNTVYHTLLYEEKKVKLPPNDAPYYTIPQDDVEYIRGKIFALAPMVCIVIHLIYIYIYVVLYPYTLPLTGTSIGFTI